MGKKVWDPFAGKMVGKGSREWKRQRASELGVLRELDPGATLKWMDREGLHYPAARGQLHREARRLGRMEGDRPWVPGGRGAETPDWLKQPWRNLWPSPPGEYARWGKRGAGQRYAGWGDWYAPQAQMKDQPHLAIINRLLPYMAPEDQTTMARQLYIAGGEGGGPFKDYLRASRGFRQPALGEPRGKGQRGKPTPPAPDTYRDTLRSIGGILGKISDPTAKAWTKAVFDVYRDWTRSTGMRTSLGQEQFTAQLGELFENVPEEAQPYAAALQRIVMPTIARPQREWYELPAAQRTTPANLRVAMGLRENPMWF